jgi:hypothetical protein
MLEQFIEDLSKEKELLKELLDILNEIEKKEQE